MNTSFSDRYQRLQERIYSSALRAGRSPEDITLIAVSKTHPPEAIERAYRFGIRNFGENYVQELRTKQAHFPRTTYPDLQWHFIGHLQRNKAKFLVGNVALIHSVDNLRLAQKISQLAVDRNLTVPILLQVNTSGESSKYGCDPEQLFALAEHIFQLPNLHVRGLMTLAAYLSPPERTRPMFALLRTLRDRLEQRFPEFAPLPELSMGMTNDFEIAIEEGATMIRIGTALFGERSAPTISLPPTSKL